MVQCLVAEGGYSVVFAWSPCVCLGFPSLSLSNNLSPWRDDLKKHKHPAWFWCLLNSPSCEEGRAQVLWGASEIQSRPPDAVPLPPLWHHGQRTASHSILILCRNNGGKCHITRIRMGVCTRSISQEAASHKPQWKTDGIFLPLSCLWANPQGNNNHCSVGFGSCKYPIFCINLLSLILSNHNAIMPSVCTVVKARVSHALETEGQWYSKETWGISWESNDYIVMAQYIKKIYSAIVFRMSCSLEASALCCFYMGSCICSEGNRELIPGEKKGVAAFSAVSLDSVTPTAKLGVFTADTAELTQNQSVSFSFLSFFFKPEQKVILTSHIFICVTERTCSFIYFPKTSHLLP